MSARDHPDALLTPRGKSFGTRKRQESARRHRTHPFLGEGTPLLAGDTGMEEPRKLASHASRRINDPQRLADSSHERRDPGLQFAMAGGFRRDWTRLQVPKEGEPDCQGGHAASTPARPPRGDRQAQSNTDDDERRPARPLSAGHQQRKHEGNGPRECHAAPQAGGLPRGLEGRSKGQEKEPTGEYR
jgi:hypothetical protein